VRRCLIVFLLLACISLCAIIVSCGGGTGSQPVTPVTPPPTQNPPPPAISFSGVLRWRYDAGITGQNLNETKLTQANVNSNQFGKLFSYPLDGLAYAQPLYVSQVAIEGKGTHNVVYVATEHNTVYAFDADTQTDPLWITNFNNPAAGVTPVPSLDLAQPVGGSPIEPEVGITSTPVIDGSTGTMYVVAATKESGKYVHRIHALDITNGKEKVNSVIISPSGSFDSQHELQRAALTLTDNIVIVCFASYSDWRPYNGWIVGYDAATLSQVAAVNTTPGGGEGSIWQSGAPLSVDGQGNIFGAIANGTFDPGNGNYGDSLVRLFPKSLVIADYFTPFNQQALNDADIDIGSGGLMLIPDQNTATPRMAITAGKEGRIYLVNRDNLGKFNPANDSQILQSIPNQLGDITRPNGRNFSTPAFWQGNIYFVANRDVIKQFKLQNGLLTTTPVAKGTQPYPFPGANMTVSSNGANDGIVWTLEAGGGGVLHAYDATNVARELYSSAQNAARDQFGKATRFSVPVVINGKVYVGGESQLAVFGPI
jgi:hypothetical protein